MQNLQIKLNKILSVLSKEYPDLICEIIVEGNSLNGYILLEKQKSFILEELHLLNKEFTENIEVLTNLKSKPKHGWGVSSVEVLDIIKTPIDNWNMLSPHGKNKLRSTQVTKNDLPFRLLHKKKDWYLIQLLDRSIGWVRDNQIAGSNPPKKSPIINLDINKLVTVAKSYIDTPYLLGGTTKTGIDCSGLTQRTIYETTNRIIPKHSGDQKKIGAEKTIERVEAGDLIFAKSIAKNISHVAIYIGDNNVIHACLRLKKVSIEPLKSFKEFYEISDIITIENNE